MFAVRNIRLCTKDCLCLYICPTGATDTENGQIDFKKCTGCRKCVDACPSGALSLMPERMPPQQKKSAAVAARLSALAADKATQEIVASGIARAEKDPIRRQFAEALALSARLTAEDIVREAGYMLPQSENTRRLLISLSKGRHDADFPAKTVQKLLDSIDFNEIDNAPNADD